MNFIYNIFVFLGILSVRIAAIFNKKFSLFINGRKETFEKLKELKKEDQIIWIHTASLGEFEQARPIIESLKENYKSHKIVLTFFSPSGYEIRKNYEKCDVICYLPMDTPLNAKKFIAKIRPEIAIFVKYEFWPNLLKQLKKQYIKTILVAGVFRKKQYFFKWYGGFMRKKLLGFDAFYVQDETSKKLLNSINFKNVIIAGDTRFDRVSTISTQNNSLDFINKFKDNQYTVVAGSTWHQDEKLLINYINNLAENNEKFIIAPHNINPKEIESLKKSITKKTILFSERSHQKLANYQILIIDTIGILTKIYASADVAYVGGGLKTGLHNILEPATFGIPVVIGNRFEKFKEVVDLVDLKGCISIKNQQEFSNIFTALKSDVKKRKSIGKINADYIQNNSGATQKIMNYLHKHLN